MYENMFHLPEPWNHISVSSFTFCFATAEIVKWAISVKGTA